MHQGIRILLIGCFIFPCSMSRAEEQAPYEHFQSLKSSFQELVEDKRSGQADFDKKYEEKLVQLEATAQKDAKLELVLAVRKEREEFRGRKEMGKSSHAELAALQRIYAEHSAKIQQQEAEDRNKMVRAYLVKLGEIRDELTRDGKIDQALEVRNEIVRGESLLTAPRETDAPGRGEHLIAESVRPGRVWAGKHPIDGRDWSIKLLADGKAEFNHRFKQDRFWAFEPPNVLYCWPTDRTKTTGWTLTIDATGKAADLKTTQGGGRGEATLRSISGEKVP